MPDLMAEIWHVVQDLPVFLTAPLYRQWHLRWGATVAEATAELPGDTLVPAAQYRSTRAITIDAPASKLVARIRAWYDWRHPLAGLSAVLLMEFGDFAMLRRMLRGIKARAEPPPQVVRMLDHGRCHRTEVSDGCDDRPSMLSRDQGLRAASRKPIT
jgi:hypothetical protein